MNKKLPILLLSLIMFFACTKNDVEDQPTNNTKTAYYVVCEGNFNGGNGDICKFYPIDNSIELNSFKAKNGRHLGDVLQSVTKQNGKLYFVVNNSNKIEIADATSMAELGVITGLSLPRNMIFKDANKALVSCWGNGGELAIVDVSKKSIDGTIQTGSGPGEMIIENNYLFVANSGGFGADSTISVINLSTMAIEKTIVVGDIPSSLVIDKNGKIWVLCQGKGSWQGETPSKIVVLNSSNFQIEKTIPLFNDKHPGLIRINTEKDKIFIGAGYGFNNIYSMNISDLSFTQQIEIQGTFYGFNIEPTKNNFFCLDAGDFQTPGTLKVFSPSGQIIKTLGVGICPNAVAF